MDIFQRDNFTCQQCENTEQTQHVHHKYYEWGRDPWDYPDDVLITLCCVCHEQETELIKSCDLTLFFRKLGFMGNDLICIQDAFLHFDKSDISRDFALFEIKGIIDTPELMDRVMVVIDTYKKEIREANGTNNLPF